ncbi:MAG: hypothetical protein JNL40_15670 [Cyclobacteriaceae bacterium]|nr:hypothetical protein [Cyclobacteriaceae bacterium]
MFKALKSDQKPIYSILVELVLIIVGVLAAIAVENWRQSIQERKAEHNYLIALFASVQADTAMLNQEIQKCYLKQKAARTLLDLANSGGTTDDAHFEEMVQSVLMGIDPFHSTSVFEDLRASGNLQLIVDEGLRNDIIRYYIRVEALMKIHESERGNISYNAAFTDVLTIEDYTFSSLNQSRVMGKLRKNLPAQAYLDRLEKQSYTAYSSLLFNMLPQSLSLLEELDAAIHGSK